MAILIKWVIWLRLATINGICHKKMDPYLFSVEIHVMGLSLKDIIRTCRSKEIYSLFELEINT